MAKIDDFRTNLKGGGARGSQFEVSLTFPGIVPGATNAANSAKFMCIGTSLPASTIESIQVPFRGRIIKVAGERSFQNWQVRILNDTDFTLRSALESWSNNILKHSETSGITNPTEYTSTLLVKQLSRSATIGATEAVIRSYSFYNCYPITISDIQLDFGDTTRIEEFTVEFSVDYWLATGDAVDPNFI